MLKVIKRDGSIVGFNGVKIENAIKKAFGAANIAFPNEYVL